MEKKRNALPMTQSPRLQFCEAIEAPVQELFVGQSLDLTIVPGPHGALHVPQELQGFQGSPIFKIIQFW